MKLNEIPESNPWVRGWPTFVQAKFKILASAHTLGKTFETRIATGLFLHFKNVKEVALLLVYCL